MPAKKPVQSDVSSATVADLGDSPARKIVLVGCLAFVLMFIFVPAGAGLAYLAWQGIASLSAGESDRDGRDDRDDRDRRRVDRDLLDEAMDLRMDPLHAIYFAKVCDGVANRLEADGEADEPVFTQRSEAAMLLGVTGQLATAGVNDMNYRGLPDLIELAFEEPWETDDDGNLLGGPLTPSDRDELVDRWHGLAEVFREVSK